MLVSSHSSRDFVTKILKRYLWSSAKNRLTLRSTLLQIGFVSALSYLRCGWLLKPTFHPVRKTCVLRRSAFCYTFRSLTAPSISLVSSSVKSRLSSPVASSDCFSFQEKGLCLSNTTAFAHCSSSTFKRSAFLPVVDT